MIQLLGIGIQRRAISRTQGWIVVKKKKQERCDSYTFPHHSQTNNAISTLPLPVRPVHVKLLISKLNRELLC